MLVKTIPLDENPDKAGLANITAVLFPEGTKKRKATDVSDIFFALYQDALNQFLSPFYILIKENGIRSTSDKMSSPFSTSFLSTDRVTIV